jgi:hypothetical protein
MASSSFESEILEFIRDFRFVRSNLVPSELERGASIVESADEQLARKLLLGVIQGDSPDPDTAVVGAVMRFSHNNEGALLGAMLRLLLPLLENTIPHDSSGAGITPHPHRLTEERSSQRIFGLMTVEPMYLTQKICDQCGDEIVTQSFYTCAEGCDIDFCPDCHAHTTAIFESVDEGKLQWSITSLGSVAAMCWKLSADERRCLVRQLASDWTDSAFAALAAVVVDLTNAEAVHLQDGESGNVMQHEIFWQLMCLLHLVALANVPIEKNPGKLTTVAIGKSPSTAQPAHIHIYTVYV